jgi:RecA-family ATPase
VKTRPANANGVASLIRADQVGVEQVDWLWQDRIPFGAITILGGNPGLGKSLLTVWLAASLTRGELGGGGPAGVLLSSAEDPRGQVVVPRLHAAGAVMERVHFVEINREGFDTPPLLPDDVAEMTGHIEFERIRLLVLDPLMAHLAPGVNSWKDQEIRAALLPLKAVAEKTGAAVVVVAHLNKGNSNDPLHRLGGSIGLPAAARSVLLLGRDPDDPEGVEGERRVLAHVKTNIGPKAASVAFRIEEIQVGSGSAGKIVQTGYSPHSGEDLLREEEPGRGSKRTAAIAFLLDRLAPGPQRVGDLQETAASHQISVTTLRRAKTELRIVSTKNDFDGGWLWSLPDHDRLIRTAMPSETRSSN